MPTREEIEEIRTKVNILDVVSRYVSVRPRGKSYLAICPFHPDRSPSLTVSPEKGLFHCFGCGEGGDAFTFLMKIERIEFPEAARRLAEQAGVALTGDPGRAEGLAPLRELAERVTRLYEQNLRSPSGQRAWDYLGERGLSPETIERFRLGYAPPDGGHLIRAFAGSEELLLRLGLVRVGQKSGDRWSFFRDRVIFPVTATQGEVIGLAGRTLGEGEGGPKYLNTKNTPIFEKSRVLYGLSQARAGLKEHGEALLVEGYTDVLMAHQGGFPHAVASMGTAFTAEQARLIKRFVPRALIAYDRDVAGRGATLRGMKQLLEAGLEVQVVLLPPGEDPDGLLRHSGAEAFSEALRQTMPFAEFYVQALIEELGAGSLPGQERIIQEARDFLTGLASPALRAQITKELSSSLDIPLDDLHMEMKGRRRTVTMGAASPSRGSWGVEEHLMYLLLQGEFPVSRAMEELAPPDFRRFSHAIEVLFELYREEGGPDRLSGTPGQNRLGEWLARLDLEEQQELRALAVSERRDVDSEKAIAELIGQLQVAGAERRLRALKREIEEADKRRDREVVQRLQREQQEHLKELQRLLRQQKTARLGRGEIVTQGGGTTDG